MRDIPEQLKQDASRFCGAYMMQQFLLHGDKNCRTNAYGNEYNDCNSNNWDLYQTAQPYFMITP